MGKLIESDALDRVYRTLGLSGGSVPKSTLLDDGNVSQILDINPLVRRSRTPEGSTGWYRCFLETAHSVGGTLQAAINPYSPGASGIAPYPEEVPRGFDFWLLGASLRRTSGAGGLDGAVLLIQPLTVMGGWGEDDGGAAAATNADTPVARWTGLDTSIVNFAFGIAGDGSAMAHVNLRVPRNALVKVNTDAAAAATFQTYMFCGLFPEALGQDIAK